jgi:hypothetical protein
MVNPDTGHHVVYAAADRRTPLWGFEKVFTYHVPVFLSNDGKVAAMLTPQFVLEEEVGSISCLHFWGPQGILKSYRFAELCPDPDIPRAEDKGPPGDNWLMWYRQISHAGESFTIQTTDLYEYTFSLRDGRILRRSLVWKNLLVKSWFYVGIGLVGLTALIAVQLIRYRRQKRVVPVSRPIGGVSLQTASYGCSKRFGHLS